MFDKIKFEEYMKTHTKSGEYLIYGKVKYTNTPESKLKAFNLPYYQITRYGLKDYLYKIHFKKYRNELFFNKLLDWRDQQEYRLILIGNEEGYIDVPFKD